MRRLCPRGRLALARVDFEYTEFFGRGIFLNPNKHAGGLLWGVLEHRPVFQIRPWAPGRTPHDAQLTRFETGRPVSDKPLSRKWRNAAGLRKRRQALCGGSPFWRRTGTRLQTRCPGLSPAQPAATRSCQALSEAGRPSIITAA